MLPIVIPDLSTKAGRKAHDMLVSLVDAMLHLEKSMAKSRTTLTSDSLNDRIAATDREIDQLVYVLYGLSDKEIALVEEATTA